MDAGSQEGIRVMGVRAAGELLAAQGDKVGVVVVRGRTMILGGYATRLTEDIDIIAVAGS